MILQTAKESGRIFLVDFGSVPDAPDEVHAWTTLERAREHAKELQEQYDAIMKKLYGTHKRDCFKKKLWVYTNSATSKGMLQETWLYDEHYYINITQCPVMI